MPLKVGIIGAGPAGLTLALLLDRAGFEVTVLEARDRAYVEGRVRAGLLEQNTVDLLRDLGVAERLEREGLPHTGIYLRHRDRLHHIDMVGLTGRQITIYGQQEVVKDEIAALIERQIPIKFEVSEVRLDGLAGERPSISFSHRGADHLLQCDFVAGCDGFHGISRRSIPAERRRELEFVYPFSWLGILAEAKPSTDELIYAWHERGFALHSMRSPEISRLYLQIPVGERIEDWPDERIWDELQARLGAVNRGPLIEKGITPMRSFVTEPMRFGRLFLAGDAAHIVPPTGAKGLNLAVNDVRLLASALGEHAGSGVQKPLEDYSRAALRRIWRAEDFSNYMTQLLHDLGGGPFEKGLQLARLEYIARSDAAARSLAENYVGLEREPDF